MIHEDMRDLPSAVSFAILRLPNAFALGSIGVNLPDSTSGGIGELVVRIRGDGVRELVPPAKSLGPAGAWRGADNACCSSCEIIDEGLDLGRWDVVVAYGKVGGGYKAGSSQGPGSS